MEKSKSYICSCQKKLISLKELENHLKEPSIHIIKKKIDKRICHKAQINRRIKFIKSFEHVLRTKELFIFSLIFQEFFRKIMFRTPFYNTKGIKQIQILSEKKNYVNLHIGIKKYFNLPLLVEITLSRYHENKLKKLMKNFHILQNCQLSCIIFSKNLNCFITGSENGIIKLWEINNLDQRMHFTFNKSPIRVIKIDSSSKYCFSGSGDGTICLWSIKARKIKSCLKGHTDEILCLIINSENSSFVSSSSDNTIRVWRFNPSKLIHKICLSSAVVFLKHIKDKIYLIFATNSHIGALYNFKLKNSLSKINNDDRDVSIIKCCVFNKNNGCLVTGCENGTIINFELFTNKELQRRKIHNDTILSLKYLSTSNKIISTSLDKNIMLLNSNTLLPLDTINVESIPLSAIKFKNNFLILYDDFTLSEYDSQNMKKVSEEKNFHFNKFVDFSNDLTKVLHGQKEIKLTDLISNELLTCVNFPGPIRSFCFDNSFVICGTNLGYIYLFEIMKDVEPILNLILQFCFEAERITFITANKNHSVLAYSTEKKSVFRETMNSKVLFVHDFKIILGKFNQDDFMFFDENRDLFALIKFSTLIKVKARINCFDIFPCKSEKRFLIQDSRLRFHLINVERNAIVGIFRKLKDIRIKGYAIKRKYRVISNL